jgi:hypothetical protein
MKNKLMRLYEILIPTTDNNNNLFDKNFHQEWDKVITERIGGLTLTKTEYKGKWQDQTENMIPVRIACWLNQIDDILEFTAQHYKQKSIMIYEISPNVIIYQKI